MFGDWKTCNACLQACMDNTPQCAEDLFSNFMGLTLIKMSAMADPDDANKYSESVQAEKKKLHMYADKVKDSKAELSFGNALMKCRTNVEFYPKETKKQMLMGDNLIPRLQPVCTPQQANVAQQKAAQKAFTEFVMASLNTTRGSKTARVQSKDLETHEEQSKDVLEAVVSAEVGEVGGQLVTIEIGEVADTINGNHTLNEASDGALALKLGIAAYIHGYGGNPEDIQDVQDAADGLSVLSIPLGTVLGFLKMALGAGR